MMLKRFTLKTRAESNLVRTYCVQYKDESINNWKKQLPPKENKCDHGQIYPILACFISIPPEMEYRNETLG